MRSIGKRLLPESFGILPFPTLRRCMHRFERDAIEFIVGNGILAPEIRSQLEHAVVRTRITDRDAVTTHFDIADHAPQIVPANLEAADDLDVDAYGVISARVIVTDGRLSSLSFSMLGRHWPAHPRILGVAPES